MPYAFMFQKFTLHITVLLGGYHFQFSSILIIFQKQYKVFCICSVDSWT